MLRVIRRSQSVGRSIIEPGTEPQTLQAVEEISRDAFGLWSLRELLAAGPPPGTRVPADTPTVVRSVKDGILEGRYVFVRAQGRNAQAPPPPPPPQAGPPPAKQEKKKETKPWTLDVTAATDGKYAWPKGDVTIELSGPTLSSKTTKMTSNKSPAVRFEGDHEAPREYEVKAWADGWDPVGTQKVQLKNDDAKTLEVQLAPPQVHLGLHYTTPDEAIHPFPKDFAVQVVFDDASTKDLKVEDDKGWLHFEIEKGKAKFTLKFDHAKVRYLVHPAPGGAEKPAVEEDLDDEKLRKHATDGKPFFALPKKWSLVHAKWDAPGVVVPQDGQIAIPDAGIGKKDTPAKLTLVPKVQYVRFEFHDRKFWKDHAKKRVAIPCVPLKGARKSDGAGAPTDPVAGTHDAVAGWMVDADDDGKACQALPWVVTRKDDGAELAKLDKDMLLEWGWEKGFVHSKSKTERVVVTLEPADDKRKPSKDRSQYYDLPKAWKSKCWWTRTSDATKNRLFDELTPEIVELSHAKATPMTFSLDDIVLVDSAGTSQAVKDKDKADGAKDRSKHSRVAVLHLDPEDEFEVKVHDPRADAAYHSKTAFTKEAGADVWRNVIVDYPLNARVVVFANGFHDVWDKRTETADFAKKEILGARAARIRDADVTVARKFDQAADVTAGYVHKTRIVDVYYLHYGATDGTTVYGAAVTHWSGRIFSKLANASAGWDNTKRPLSENLADLRNYQGAGMKHAMERWNDKRYRYEEADGKTDIAIRSFMLFEAKDIEDPPNSGTFVQVGGKHHCDVGVGTDAVGSSATDVWMFMRRSGYRDEGSGWGSLPATEVRENDYDGSSAAARCAFAHELGHAAIGLWDDYVTEKHEKVVPTYKTKQRYPGMPFERDRSSIMNSNQATRVRQLGGRTKWLNDEAAATKTLHKFLGARKFRGTYAPAGKTKLLYELGTGSKTFYVPSVTEAGVALGEQGKCDLHLYELGDDEFAQILKGGPYDAMLVADVKLCATFVNGVDPAATGWVTGTAYAVGAVVDHDAKFYVCLTGHTSGTFATDLGAKRWFELDPAKDKKAWTVGTNYNPQEWLTAGADHYVCLEAHKSGDLIPKNFIERSGTASPWAASTGYAKGNVSTQGGVTRICTESHTSGPALDGSKWLQLGTFHGAFASGLAFAAGDYCTHSSKTYVCTTPHTGGSLDADRQAGRIARSASGKKEWTANQKKSWIVRVNQDLRNQADAPDGKFKFVAADLTNAFARCYLRLFPQWQEKATPATANPGGTQFSFEVAKGGSTLFFGAAGAAVKAGENSSAATLARYLLGRISDNAATRATQDSTSDLAKADFVKLKGWMDTNAGGTFTVEDIA